MNAAVSVAQALPHKVSYLTARPEAGEESSARSDSGKAAEKTGRLRELCNEMESIFVSVLMRQMRQTIWESDFLPRSPGEDMFRSLWEAEVAGRMQGRLGGFGIADSIYRELERSGEWQKTHLHSPSSSL